MDNLTEAVQIVTYLTQLLQGRRDQEETVAIISQLGTGKMYGKNIINI